MMGTTFSRNKQKQDNTKTEALEYSIRYNKNALYQNEEYALQKDGVYYNDNNKDRVYSMN